MQYTKFHPVAGGGGGGEGGTKVLDHRFSHFVDPFSPKMAGPLQTSR